MKRSLAGLTVATLAIGLFGCSGGESDEAATATKSNEKFEMSGEAGADTTGGGGGSAKAGSDSESSDH